MLAGLQLARSRRSAPERVAVSADYGARLRGLSIALGRVESQCKSGRDRSGSSIEDVVQATIVGTVGDVAGLTLQQEVDDEVLEAPSSPVALLVERCG